MIPPITYKMLCKLQKKAVEIVKLTDAALHMEDEGMRDKLVCDITDLNEEMDSLVSCNWH